MAAVSSWAAALALCTAGVEGARVSRKRAIEVTAPRSKFIAGVPVLNYHTVQKASFGEHEGLEEEQEWVLMARPDTTEPQLRALCARSRHACGLLGHPSSGAPFVELRGTERDLEAVLQSAAGTIRYVEPDHKVSMIPELQADDPEAATWGLNRIGADRRGRAGAGATIFILDTGVRVTHQEFGSRAAPALDMSGREPKECRGDMSCAGDRQGHGTHCAGSAAGTSYGVASGASVQAVKVLNDAGSGKWSWSYYALGWLATHPARPAVASMSLGGDGTQQAMQDSVDAAVNAGVIVVVAGGNANSDACEFSPAFVPSAITVGSTTSLDKRSSFSNYGRCTNLWAPGSNILSAGHRSDTDTDILSGTSMACPHVSGAVALELQADPSKKASAVLQAMLDHAVVDAISGLKPEDTNALLYVGEGGPPPTPVPAPTPPASSCPAAFSYGPDSFGDCSCNSGLYCCENGRYKCTTTDGHRALKSFSPDCETCTCQESC